LELVSKALEEGIVLAQPNDLATAVKIIQLKYFQEIETSTLPT
jgi:hypothetical protein